MKKLAINGGTRICKNAIPSRKLFGEDELEMVKRVFEHSWKEGKDFGYQGKFEKLYTDKFCEFQGGGYADAVSSGTAAVYLALKALQLERGKDIVVSPVTDPGGLTPVIEAGMRPVVADSQSGSFNVGPDEFEKALTPKTCAALLTHVGGYAVDMEPILEIADEKNIKIIEDCSQAHGAMYKGKRVGCFGDIGVFSTMFSKNHATGGCGGLVYTQNRDYYSLVRSFADRGKAFAAPDFDPKDPSKSIFPALNFNLDEVSCAIGLSTLSKLQKIIDKRLTIAGRIDSVLQKSSVVSPFIAVSDCKPSIFFYTAEVSTEKIKVSKTEFAEAVAAEGVWINPDYRYVVSEWPWVQKYLKGNAKTPNAVKFRDRTFNILFHERFRDENISDIGEAILKVEECFKQ